MKTSNEFRSMRNKIVYFRDQLNKYGPLIAPYLILHEFFYKRYFGLKNIYFPDFSKNLPITASRSLYSDSHENKESSWFAIKKAFNKIPIPCEEIRLLDIGCGSGKSMLMGMKLKFLEVIGIDLDTPSIEQGLRNCEKMKLFGSPTCFSLKQYDAATFKNIADGINLIYLFNPFGKTTMSKVVNNIESFVKNQPADVFIIYMNPLYLELFTEINCFETYYSSYFKGGNKKEMVIFRANRNLCKPL